MWNIDQIEKIPVTLDYGTSGQGCLAATAIEAEGVRLFNAIELVDFEASPTQVIVCESCGVLHCAPGGCVAFRRIGERVIWIPAWDEMEESEQERAEYQPPAYLAGKGIPFFSVSAWDLLGTIHPDLPTIGMIPPLDSREAARLCQRSAPGRILGEFPSEPELHRDALLAATERELETEAEAIDSFLHEHFDARCPMKPLPSTVKPLPIELWIDLPGSPGWISFAHLRDGLCFLVDGDLALAGEGDSEDRG